MWVVALCPVRRLHDTHTQTFVTHREKKTLASHSPSPLLSVYSVNNGLIYSHDQFCKLRMRRFLGSPSSVFLQSQRNGFPVVYLRCCCIFAQEEKRERKALVVLFASAAQVFLPELKTASQPFADGRSSQRLSVAHDGTGRRRCSCRHWLLCLRVCRGRRCPR